MKVKNLEASLSTKAKEEMGFDEVEKPYHYNIMGEQKDGRSIYEPVNVIEAWGWGEGFCYGNAIKYILRAPHKGTEESDLKKALWYLERLLSIRRACCERVPSDECMPMNVARAWKLPGRLQRAIELISQGDCGGAAHEVALYLNEFWMAREIAEEEDKRILEEVEKALQETSEIPKEIADETDREIFRGLAEKEEE